MFCSALHAAPELEGMQGISSECESSPPRTPLKRGHIFNKDTLLFPQEQCETSLI